ncbi:MAG: FAD-dependent oxidoreductase [Actinomycetota bacterium]
MSDFDVVVVGAGLGGLSAAVSLSREGKKVLLLERHRVPGGYASSFKRGPYEFEVSLHELSGLGTPEDRGPLFKLFEQTGVAERVEFLPIPEFYRSVFPDVDVTIPLGRENFEQELSRHFPAEAENIREFSRIMFDFADQALKANRVGMKKVMDDPADYPVLMQCFGKSLSQVLNPIIADEKARAVLGQIWGYYCLPPSQLSFLIYALGTVSYLRFGPAHIRGTSQALSQALMDIVEENGGVVRLNEGASRVLATGGSVYGVVTDAGEKIDCPYVVSNANPVTTCLDLIGRDEIPSWYLRRLGAGSGGASTFNVYLGLDCDYHELGLANHETFVNTGYDLDGHYELMKKGIDVEPAEAAVTAYNAIDPGVSPPGTTVMVITLIARAEPWMEVPPERYNDTKAAVADRVIGLAERVAPDIRKHIDVVEVATPVTNARYTGNIAGSIIGFNETFAGTGMARMPARGPLDGLYFANAWVNIGGGYEPSIYGGYITAREVLQDMEGGRDARVAEKLKLSVEEQSGDAAEVDAAIASPMKGALERLHPARVPLRVSEIIEETPSTKTLRMVPSDGDLPPFRAGQYVNLFVEVDGVGTSRPYSISSRPGEPYYDITVRRAPAGFVSGYLLDSVAVGDTFECTAPGGSFYHEPLADTSSLVFLAGGSGITTFASIARDALERSLPLDMHLIYGSRDPADVIFADELAALAAGPDNFRLDVVISEPPADWTGLCGLLDADTISGLVGTTEGKTFYMCGPQAMYGLCAGALESLGVPARRVKREAYGPPADVTAEPGWPGVASDAVFQIVEERSGRTVEARAAEPLMNSLERSGLVVPAMCRAGECAACRTRLVSGRVFAPERVSLRRVDVASGYIHPCMSYPLEDLRIRL